ACEFLCGGKNLYRDDRQGHGSLHVLNDFDLALNAAVRNFAAQGLCDSRSDVTNGCLHRVQERVKFGGRDRIRFTVTRGIQNKINRHFGAQGQSVQASAGEFVLLHLVQRGTVRGRELRGILPAPADRFERTGRRQQCALERGKQGGIDLFTGKNHCDACTWWIACSSKSGNAL